MVLNTLLAFIPIELSFHIDVGKPKNMILFWLLIIVWMLFYPNTPYLLTDLFHLSLLNPYGVNGLLRLDDTMWLKFSLLLISTIFSTLLGMWGLDRIAAAISARFKMSDMPVFKDLVIIILTILSSIGIFIGRFLRIHTIYLFLTPEMFIRPLLNMWSHSAIVFIVLLTVVQLVFYYTLKLISSQKGLGQ
ncbi:membrane protein [Lentilactobacillus diolivorans]|uniref:Membrane protein n=1 Tax=Lentilactobacillus diolivorans TaxID=179838 RepID=A0ABQ0XHN2_9LACO|nr:membrane protein [Lentilactobacillus diolivorans]